MNVVVTVVPDNPQLGDLVRLQVFVDEKIGSPQDVWKVLAPEGTSWLAAGSVTVSAASIKTLPAEGAATKLELEALLHQPGPLVVGPLQLQNEATKQEVSIPATTLASTEVPVPAKAGSELPWILPAVPFGGWNWPLITVLGVLLALGSALLARRLFQLFFRRQPDSVSYSQRALDALTSLQKYAKAKKPLQQEEWKKFSFELAGILRKYSDGTWHIDTSEMTDKELLEELRLHTSAAPFLGLLENVLATITEVRYGRKDLDLSLVPGLLLEARKFVESTVPQVKAEEKK